MDAKRNVGLRYFRVSGELESHLYRLEPPLYLHGQPAPSLLDFFSDVASYLRFLGVSQEAGQLGWRFCLSIAVEREQRSCLPPFPMDGTAVLINLSPGLESLSIGLDLCHETVELAPGEGFALSVPSRSSAEWRVVSRHRGMTAIVTASDAVLSSPLAPAVPAPLLV